MTVPGDGAALKIGEVAPNAGVRRSCEALWVAGMTARTRSREVAAVESEPRVLRHGRRHPIVLRMAIPAGSWQHVHVHGVRRRGVRGEVTGGAIGRRSRKARRSAGVAVPARCRRVLAVEQEPMVIGQRRRIPADGRVTRGALLGKSAGMTRADGGSERRGVATDAGRFTCFSRLVNIVGLRASTEARRRGEKTHPEPHGAPVRRRGSSARS